jgi:DNA-directed RNA polymerase specialized sigma24 family protein
MEALMDGDSLGAVVARAGTGDELAFARIVAAHHDDMTRVCFVICGDADLAQEAVQAAWPRAWQ